MANPELFLGQEATVKIGDELTDVTTDSNLDSQLSTSTDYSGIVTDITITDPEASIDVLNTFGGQVKEESPFDLVTVDFTMRFNDLEIFEELHGTASSITSGSSWSRISGGATIGSRPGKAILFKVSKTVDGTTYTMHYLLNSAWFQQDGEISLAADGSAELTGTAVSLIEDRYIEKNW